MLGLDALKRQVVRILTEAKDLFIDEACDVPRAGLEHARWISVDETGSRHQGNNGFCTQFGNTSSHFLLPTIEEPVQFP
jgi:hypothetical protein